MTEKQLEIEKFTKEILSIAKQYKKDKKNGLNPKEFIEIDNEYLDYLFGQEKENAN